jgi:hypothetical protein
VAERQGEGFSRGGLRIDSDNAAGREVGWCVAAIIEWDEEFLSALGVEGEWPVADVWMGCAVRP